MSLKFLNLWYFVFVSLTKYRSPTALLNLEFFYKTTYFCDFILLITFIENLSKQKFFVFLKNKWNMSCIVYENRIKIWKEYCFSIKMRLYEIIIIKNYLFTYASESSSSCFTMLNTLKIAWNGFLTHCYVCKVFEISDFTFLLLYHNLMPSIEQKFISCNFRLCRFKLWITKFVTFYKV